MKARKFQRRRWKGAYALLFVTAMTKTVEKKSMA